MQDVLTHLGKMLYRIQLHHQRPDAKDTQSAYKKLVGDHKGARLKRRGEPRSSWPG